MLIKANPGTWFDLRDIARADVSGGAVRLVMKQGGFVPCDLSADELERLSAPAVPSQGLGPVFAWRVLPDGAEPALRSGGNAA